MKKLMIKSFKVLLIAILGISIFTACSKTKDIVLGDAKKEEELSRKQSLKVSEKKIEIPEDYRVFKWKNHKELLLTKEDNRIFSFNIETKEVKELISDNKSLGILVDTVYGKSEGGDGQVLFIKNFKLFLYEANKNTIDEILDLSEAKKEVGAKYKVEDDFSLNEKLRIGFVDGCKDKVYVIAHAQYDGYHKESVRIIDVNSKRVLTSEAYVDPYLVEVMIYQNKYYVSALFHTFYEIKTNNDGIKLSEITKSIQGANSAVFITKEGRVMEGGVTRNNDGEFKFYNLLKNSDEKPFQFEDREKLAAVNVSNYNIKNNIVAFTKSYKERVKEGEPKEKDFIGLVNENKIETIYKISDYEEKGNTDSWSSSIFNENGDKMVLRRGIYNMLKDNKLKKSITEYLLIEFK